jgi:hypothetical protein
LDRSLIPTIGQDLDPRLTQEAVTWALSSQSVGDKPSATLMVFRLLLMLISLTYCHEFGSK